MVWSVLYLVREIGSIADPIVCKNRPQREESIEQRSLLSSPVRIMRALVVMGIFNEDDSETYSANKLSKSLANPAFRSVITGMYVNTQTQNHEF